MRIQLLMYLLMASAIMWQVGGVGIKRRMALAAERDEPTGGEDAGAKSHEASSSSRKRGIKQRLQQTEGPAQSASSSQTAPEPLFKRLVQRWAEGKISSVEVQRIAMDAEASGTRGMTDMASIGTGGKHPQNCFRALHSLLGLPSGAPTFYWAEIPTIRGDRTPHPFLLPHEFFASMFTAENAKFVSTIRGPVGAALEFWTSMQGTDFLRLHPSLPKGRWPKTIPLGLHGDGAAFSKQDSVYTFSWNSLIGSGVTMQKRFVCTIIKKTDMTSGTLDAIAKVLSWSFNALLDGHAPAETWEGKPVAGGGRCDPLAGGGEAHCVKCEATGRFTKSSSTFQLGMLPRGCASSAKPPPMGHCLGCSSAPMQAGGRRSGHTKHTCGSCDEQAWRSQRCSSVALAFASTV